MRPTWFLALAIALAVCPVGRAQTPAAKVVTFDDVVKQVRAGASPADILDNCQVIYTLTPEQKDELLKAKAPVALVDALQVKRIKIGDVTDFVVILDCSGSMKDEIGKGVTKMDAAKKVVGELFKAIPNGRNLAFIVYGHDAALECKAIKVVRPLGPVNDDARKELAGELAALSPKGHTPIAGSLKAAGEVLAKSDGMSQVIVITDGVETCHGDPAAEAERLTQKVKGLRAVEVIGVGLDKDEKAAVAVIARRGRGKFYDADSAAHLKEAVAKAADVTIDDKPKPADPKPAAPAELTAIEKALIKQLKDDDAGVRHTAAESLLKRGKKAKEVLDALAERVADDVWTGGGISQDNAHGSTSKDAALKALVALAPDRAEAALVAAAKSKREHVRLWAAESLGARAKDKPTGDDTIPAGAKTLIALLADESAGVRRAAAVSLGARKDKAKEVLDALASRVTDEVWGGGDAFTADNATGSTSKDAALKALKELAPARVEDALLKAMDSKNKTVKQWATKAIEKLDK